MLCQSVTESGVAPGRRNECRQGQEVMKRNTYREKEDDSVLQEM